MRSSSVAWATAWSRAAGRATASRGSARRRAARAAVGGRNAVERCRLGRGREQVGVTRARELSFDQKQVSPGGAVYLPLLLRRVPRVAVRHPLRDAERCQHHPVGERLRFPAGRAPKYASKVTGEGDALLPESQVAK